MVEEEEEEEEGGNIRQNLNDSSGLLVQTVVPSGDRHICKTRSL